MAFASGGHSLLVVCFLRSGLRPCPGPVFLCFVPDAVGCSVCGFCCAGAGAGES